MHIGPNCLPKRSRIQFEMSTQDIRNEIILDNLPKLIKHLTGFEEDDEKTRRCEHLAWTIVRNHRNLSTNSHEVKRKIEGIQEKFIVENCQEYADRLGVLCDEVVNHPLCREHYETDVHWSLLDFLFALAYNPAGALKRNKHLIDLNGKKPTAETNQNEIAYFKELLKEDFIPLAPYESNDSEDWSDDSGVATRDNLNTSVREEVARSFVVTKHTLQPPVKQKPYKDFDSSKSQVYLLQNLQNTWWLPLERHSLPAVYSRRIEANFTQVYTDFLMETSNYFIRIKEPSTATELCLMRELLWMFHFPQSCKFFHVDSKKGIQVRSDVSVPSITVKALAIFLEQNFLHWIDVMSNVRSFLRLVHADFNAPKTFECYAANLRYLLTPIWQEILDYEARLIRQSAFEISSILHLHKKLEQPFSMLQSIYEIHSEAAINFKQFPAHIASSYLLAKLMDMCRGASCATSANLAASLYLTSIKPFCVIIDTWWTEGRLDDCHQEFFIESLSTHTAEQKIRVRQFSKNKQTAFFVPSSISNIVTQDSCFQLMVEHSLEAGCTLNFLCDINRISDLRNAGEVIERDLYSVFIDEVMKHIRRLQSHLMSDSDSKSAVNSNQAEEESDRSTTLSSLITTDEFLLAVFASSTNENNQTPFEEETMELNAYGVWKLLQQTPNTVLPLEEVVFTTLTRILKTRIAFANNFVVKLYLHEFHIMKHLWNIRRVFLLEASDIMYEFYASLFKNLELHKPLPNSFSLTMQLADMICVRLPEISSLFQVEVRPSLRSTYIMVACNADDITLAYSLSREVSLIITDSDIAQYNEVFRLLLKVKWGMLALDSLTFAQAHKRRAPYAHFAMIDFLMRRLQQLRLWMTYSVQSIHLHLTTHVLLSMGEQLDEKMQNCSNLREMQMVHNSYINTLCDQCFLTPHYKRIKMGIEQLLNLIFIMRMDWDHCVTCIDNNHPLAVDVSDSNSESSDADYVSLEQIETLEGTYIQCHQYLAKRLKEEVYLRKRTFLAGLSSAFNTSLPY